MGAQRSSFGKLQRDRDKKARAAAKRERRQERIDPDAGPADVGATSGDDRANQLSTPELLQRLDEVHKQFDDGVIDFDTFEERKAELLSRLTID